jgi:Sulfotransferase family
MLCATGEAGYIHEPFNPKRRPGWGGGRVPWWYLYVTERNEDFYRPMIERALAFRYPIVHNLPALTSARRAALFGLDLARSLPPRVRRARPVVKDPIALFAAEWLARTYDMHVVVMIRHPAAFASSIKRLNWRFEFRDWLAQDDLIADYLRRWHKQMHDCWANKVDVIEHAIVMWNAIHDVVDLYRRRHPEWVFVRYEDLADAPQDGFRALYESAGLEWNERAAAAIARSSDATNPKEVPLWRHQSIKRSSSAAKDTWRTRLTEEEIERITAGTSEIAARFYD